MSHHVYPILAHHAPVRAVREAGGLPSLYGPRFLPGSLSLERTAARSAARSARPPAVPLRSTLSLLFSGTLRF